MTKPRDEEEAALLTAYLDGVGELTPAERRAAQAVLPERRAEADATRDLLAALRALPPEGTEPAWSELARKISDEVGDRAPSPWWRRLRVPIAIGFAVAAAALVWLHAHGDGPTAAIPAPIATAPRPAPTPVPAAAPSLIYLNGEAIEVGELDAAPEAALDALDADRPSPGDEVVGGALMPTPDLAWIDDLDTESLAVAERWLDRKGT